jgi:translation initiation factor IF-2
LSTRVHELAKELGLKSQELLDRIQSWGLDVKASPLASLDTSMVDRIKQMHAAPQGQTNAPKAPTAAPTPPKPAPVSRPIPPETPAISSSATAESRHSHGTTARPTAVATAPTPTSPPSTLTAPGAAPIPPTTAAPLSASAPALSRPPTPTPTASAATAPPPVEVSAPTPPPSSAAAAPSRQPVGAGPLARHGGLSSSGPPRGGGGPLSGHTTHRGAPGSGPPRPAGPPSPPQDYRPNPSTPPPLKRSDYISPTGTRTAGRPAGPPPAGQGPSPPPRRPEDGGAGRTSRPLPSVAAPLPSVAGPPRRPNGPGGGPRPSGPEVKTQRPEKRYTPAELMAMMRSGTLDPQSSSAAPAARNAPGTGTRPGGGPSGLNRGPTPGPNRPGSGPMPPGGRRPLAGTAPVAPPAPVATVEDEDEKGKGKAGGRIGSPADRAGRRAKRNERATERTRVTSPVSTAVILNETEEEAAARRRSGGRKPKGGRHVAIAPNRKSHAQIEPPINLRGLSSSIGVPVKDLIKRLMNNMGQMVTINATLEEESAQMLALEFGVELEIVHERTAEDDWLDSFEPDAVDSEGLVPRPPVITILGHVDHGKTSLLDKIRKANVVDSESGGITQHIGAYSVQHDGKTITFVDTPGHEAFTAMRARGANVTDIVVLVVAADDGVMPQTKEAIDHAKAADVPIVVALNKIDLPNVESSANINKIYGELSQQGLNPAEWGGDVEIVRTSTLTGRGIDDLLVTLDAIADLKELKANPTRAAQGTCLEASISEGRGVVATVLVQDGTLKVGDNLVCGDGFGRVRALFNDKGQSVSEAGPSTPVEVSGLDEVPTAGEKFAVVEDISQAREIAETRRTRTRGVNLGERQSITLENLYSKMAEQKIKNLNLILKADVQGSLEALVKELDKLENAEVPLRILLKGVGGISESDILLADASQAIVIGFRVAPEDRAMSLADEKKIEIRRYDIIYQVTDEIRKAVEGMLVPEIKEVHLGRAVVRQVFKISKVGAVAGCFVTQGTFERAAKARVLRENREIYKGSIEALKRFKDDVREVREGFECGIKITNFDDLKVDDQIEAYRIDEIRRTL